MSTRPGSTLAAMAEISDGAPAPVEELPDDEPEPNGEPLLPDEPPPKAVLARGSEEPDDPEEPEEPVPGLTAAVGRLRGGPHGMTEADPGQHGHDQNQGGHRGHQALAAPGVGRRRLRRGLGTATLRRAASCRPLLPATRRRRARPAAPRDPTPGPGVPATSRPGVSACRRPSTGWGWSGTARCRREVGAGAAGRTGAAARPPGAAARWGVLSGRLRAGESWPVAGWASGAA